MILELISSLNLSKDCQTLSKKEYLRSYGLKNIKASRMWNKGYTGEDVTIAILDSGCDVEHPMLKDKIISGKNFTRDDGSNTNIYNDYNGHGTHVAGIVSSVAKDSKLLILKVLDSTGNGAYASIIDAINYAVLQRVDIITMSLGGTRDDGDLYKAITNAINNNVLVVCAAGNKGDGNYETEERMYPGSYAEVIQVGAEDENHSIAHFSNNNKNVDLVAPGKSIISTYPNNSYAKMSGTSQAAPFVAGSLALLKHYCREDFRRTLNEDELYAQLIKHTKTIKDISRTMQGNGRLYLDMFRR